MPVALERTSGWGYLLGDECSGYAIGREALRNTLRCRDIGLPPSEFHLAIMRHYKCATIGEIISAIYDPNPRQGTMEVDPKLRVASLSPLVFQFAFPPVPGTPDSEALSIVRSAAIAAVETIVPLLGGKAGLTTDQSALVMGGALTQIPEFQRMIEDELEARGERFGRIEVVRDAAACAVRHLARLILRKGEN